METLKKKQIAIVGSRDYNWLSHVREYVRELPHGTIVVSGGAKGVDRTAEFAAKKRGLGVLLFLPQWERYGKAAGFRRNEEIVRNADVVVAFWDGKSRGTKNTIETARKLGVPLVIFKGGVKVEGM
jgi:hypothetical protein